MTIDEAKTRSVDFYSNLYTQPLEQSQFYPWFPKILTTKMNICLTRIPRTEDVKSVVDRLEVDKTRGPNGFTIKKIQKCWDLVKAMLWTGLHTYSWDIVW